MSASLIIQDCLAVTSDSLLFGKTHIWGQTMGLEKDRETMSGIGLLCGPLCYILQTVYVALGLFNNCQNGLKNDHSGWVSARTIVFHGQYMCVLSQQDTFLILYCLCAYYGETEACRKKHTDPSWPVNWLARISMALERSQCHRSRALYHLSWGIFNPLIAIY